MFDFTISSFRRSGSNLSAPTSASSASFHSESTRRRSTHLDNTNTSSFESSAGGLTIASGADPLSQEQQPQDYHNKSSSKRHRRRKTRSSHTFRFSSWRKRLLRQCPQICSCLAAARHTKQKHQNQQHTTTMGSVDGIQRSGSMAYPKNKAGDAFAKLQFFLRQHSTPVLATVAFLSLILVLGSNNLKEWQKTSTSVLRKNASNFLHPSGSINWGGAVHPGYFANPATLAPHNNGFPFVAVTDLDQLSKVEKAGEKTKWRSVLAPGRITLQPDGQKYSIQFDKPRTLYTNHNEAGRGAEFSELSIYNKRLLTFDDRTVRRNNSMMGKRSLLSVCV